MTAVTVIMINSDFMIVKVTLAKQKIGLRRRQSYSKRKSPLSGITAQHEPQQNPVLVFSITLSQ